MLTILHLAPKLKAGGTGALASDLAEELELCGKTQNLIMSPVGRRGARVPYIPFPSGNSLLRGGLWLHSFLHRTKVDIIVAYTECAAWIAGRLFCNKSVSDRPALIGALTTYPHKHLLGCGWQYCDAFSVVSRHLRSEWENFSPLFRRKTPWVIPYGTRETWCHPGYRSPQSWKDKWNERFMPMPDELTLCLPAPITPLHGHESLVPLLSALRRNNLNPRVFLAGDCGKASPRYLEHLKGLFRQAQEDKNIVWLGARPDLRDVLCACDITISLDKQPASYNRPIQEALSLGRPVTGYDHGSVGELLSAFLPEGRVAPNQLDAMVDTITQWSFYRPTPVESVPYPYRLADTAENYMDLFSTLRP